jgi:hypothetical protein
MRVSKRDTNTVSSMRKDFALLRRRLIRTRDNGECRQSRGRANLGDAGDARTSYHDNSHGV